MKTGDLVTWAGWLGIIIDMRKFAPRVKILWADGAEPSWRRASDVEVVNEDR